MTALKSVIVRSKDLFLGHFPPVARHIRTEDVPSSEEVLGHFAERMNSLAEGAAVAEAKRCMSCGMCFGVRQLRYFLSARCGIPRTEKTSNLRSLCCNGL